MDQLLAGPEGVIVYIDSILISALIVKQHLEPLSVILSRLSMLA